MATLVRFDRFDQFKEARAVKTERVNDSVIATVRLLDERKELEPYLLSVLGDSNQTPHGPAEIADIFTHKLSLSGNEGMAAFILKGKSFPTVHPKDVSHQIYRLKKISGLRYAFFAASGTVLDAAKEQFISTAQEINCSYSILDAKDLSRLLIGYGFLCPKDGRKIRSGRCRCGYSPQFRILNHLQIEALKELRKAHDLGQRAGLVVLPTGTGKTRIAAEDAFHQSAKSVLYIAHRHEILDVAQSEFEAKFGAASVTRPNSGSCLAKRATVTLATIQLITRNLHRIARNDFDYLVIDEFHHSAANSYRRLLDSTDPHFLLGLTATPFRTDRQDIAEICNHNVLVEFELRSGIDSGILTPYLYYGCFDDIDYSKLKWNGQRYDIHDLEKALVVPERDLAVIGKWRELCEGKPTLAFCCSHIHAERVAAHFNQNGIRASVYLDSTPTKTRHQLEAKLADGELRALCVVDVLNEGADIPFVECLLFLRPTESKLLFYQQLGRGLRRFPGKEHCVVIDFIGNFKNAYRLLDYQPLLPMPEEEVASTLASKKTSKEIFNLPRRCEVRFDEKVVDLFARQTYGDAGCATRHNIARILIYEYEKLERHLGRTPTAADVRRYQLLGVDLYISVFKSWQNFLNLMATR